MKNSIFFAVVSLLISPLATWAGNLHLIQKNPVTGFAIYRLGAPDAQDMAQLCKLGVQEIMVLSGNSQKYEEKHQEACPTLKVIYNEKQSPKKPLTSEFLEDFDKWVGDAQAQGKKIAFRCTCGCHRTGRLAAYYQMKYQDLTASDAIAIMMKHGKWMFLYPGLDNQVRALNDYIQGRECTEKRKWCVMTSAEQSRYEYPEYTDEEEARESQL